MKFALCVMLGTLSQPVLAESPVDFSREILPILSNKCFVCHGPDGEAKDVLRLDSHAEATKDLEGHRAIDPKSPEKSELLARIHSSKDPMPPKDADKQLTATERELLSRWIKQGGNYAVHWSFIPPVKTSPPPLKTAKPLSPIDGFIQAKLQSKNLELAPKADRATLARRAALVLTGLPPEPVLLKKFLADDAPQAYEKFVDQLLESPRYGEHQARYWLDAVRYGDTHGLHLDSRRGIYPYRDWVIHAFNKNLPLDEFIVWQLAGDLLPNPTLEQQVATGYVRMNPTTSEGGVIPAEFQAKNNFDRVETLGTVFLGMSLTCARCHTHKFDPVLQTEYYQLMAFFNNTAEGALDRNKYDYAPVVKAPGSVSAWKDWNRILIQQTQLLKDAQSRIPQPIKAQWQKADPAKQLKMLANPKGPLGKLPLHPKAVKLFAEVLAMEKGYSTTLVAKDLPKPRATHVLKRGEYNLPIGDPLKPGTLAVMGAIPENMPPNRLGLAQWLTARNHPLVARVLINRVWQRTFGEGLVRTPEDFGLQGEQPTHPQLLDWLAVELHESDWNLKHMLRLMVTSHAFQQQSAFRKGIDDPQNRLLARGPRHRLDAEVIRDTALWASGLLDDAMGGEGVKPYQPKGLWSALMHPASNTKNYVQDKGAKQYRRSLYVYWKRTCPHPVLTLFDAPSRESSCVKRSCTNTSLQSLGLLNETQRTEAARKLAEHLLKESATDQVRVNLLFTLLACREAKPLEQAACLKLVKAMRTRYEKSPQDAIAFLSVGESPRDPSLEPKELAAWSQLTIIILASDAAILLY